MANKEILARVKHKRDTSSNWTQNNPILLNGEIILVDTAEGELRAKIGDGTKTYTQLPFSDEALRSLINDSKVTVDDALSSTSTNPVQNKVVNTAISNLSTLVGDTAVSTQISNAVETKLDKDDAAWTQIYDSGAITSEVNAFYGIDVSGYKRLKVAIKSVGTASNTAATGGAIVFTGENSRDYVFANILSNLVRGNGSTAGGFANFMVIGNYIICEGSYRAISATNMLSDDEGSGADNLTALNGGFIKCTSPLSTMMVTNANQSDAYYFGTGSRVIVWGCKV